MWSKMSQNSSHEGEKEVFTAKTAKVSENRYFEADMQRENAEAII